MEPPPQVPAIAGETSKWPLLPKKQAQAEVEIARTSDSLAYSTGGIVQDLPASSMVSDHESRRRETTLARFSADRGKAWGAMVFTVWWECGGAMHKP